jgi:hypothetical protein
MVKKPKTVAFRVTEEEYEAMLDHLAFYKKLPETAGFSHVKTVAHLVEHLIEDEMEGMVLRLRKAKKNAEAAEKRKAKKAANDAK